MLRRLILVCQHWDLLTLKFHNIVAQFLRIVRLCRKILWLGNFYKLPCKMISCISLFLKFIICYTNLPAPLPLAYIFLDYQKKKKLFFCSMNILSHIHVHKEIIFYLKTLFSKWEQIFVYSTYRVLEEQWEIFLCMYYMTWSSETDSDWYHNQVILGLNHILYTEKYINISNNTIEIA